ncbi:MAG TPA: tRNA lysidine(34) synthetase TilS [Acidimicrobiia bacterium]
MARPGERPHGVAADFDGLEAPVVVACSGGPDSTALLALAAAAGLAPTAVHVDHCARPGSAAEAGVVAGFAARLEAGFMAERAPTTPGPGFEARAREARYAALERAREALGATAVLVGHTRDDQAETVLLNILRGGATTGLAGIPPRRDRIVRPLLGVPRAELAGLCARLGIDPLVDPMNADPAHRRVWLRREMIPALEETADRDLRALLARQAAVARGESNLLDDLAGEALLAAGDPPSVDALAGLPEALARRVVRLWLGPPAPSAGHIETVLGILVGRRRAADLPGGIRVVRSGGHLHRVEARPDGAKGSGDTPGPPGAVTVDLPGTAWGHGLLLESWVERSAPVRWPDGRWTAVLDAERVGATGVLRTARPGERFVPLGLAGHKSVIDALAEAGVPAEERNRHPLLATPGGEVIWLVGYRVDDRVRVSAETRRFLWLTVEAVEAGGSGG